MHAYDWIVVGGGLTGAALAYELQRAGCSTLLIERDSIPDNATRFSYGGIPYWSGTTAITRQLCAEGIARHRILSEELDADTEFREIDLLLTVDLHGDPQALASEYANCAIPPTLLTVEAACALEPLLNPQAIAGVLAFKHAGVNAQLLADAYLSAFARAGGKVLRATVQQLLKGDRTVNGVVTSEGAFHAGNVAICAGGLSRSLLKASGISNVPIYFTHAELIETEPVDIALRAIVMPAKIERFQQEVQASRGEADSLWDRPDRELAPVSIDAGAIQFRDRSIKIGQLSRVLTDPYAQINAAESEAAIRSEIGRVLPALASLPGKWHHCLVAFSSDLLPLVGSLPNAENAYLFSGFTGPLVFVPPLASRFAKYVTESTDEIIPQLTPQRFDTLSS